MTKLKDSQGNEIPHNAVLSTFLRSDTLFDFIVNMRAENAGAYAVRLDPRTEDNLVDIYIKLTNEQETLT